MIFKFSLLVALVMCFQAHIDAQTRSDDQSLIKTIFSDRYDRRIRPLNNAERSGPVIVTVNLFVRSITKLENNEFDVQLTFRQKWQDERLKFSGDGNKYLNLISPQDLAWVPDTFFANEKEATLHNLMTRNEYIRVSPNGDVLQSARISLKLSCPMNFRNFPHDRQVCSIRLASYGYTNKEVIYQWKAQDPIQVTKTLHLPVQTLEKFFTSSQNSETNTGAYSSLQVDFTFMRSFRYYMINIYIPCIMLVIVAYLSFWINVKAITARTIVLIVTLVVFAIQTSNNNKTLPQVSYTRAIDVWNGVSITFPFVALVEFIIVQYIARQEEHVKSRSVGDEEDQVPLKKNEGSATGEEGKNQSGIKCAIQKYCKNLGSAASEKIDGAFRIGYPVVFVIFVVWYAIAYCPSSSE